MKFSDIEQVYCLSLARRQDRRDLVSKNLQNAGIEFKFFDAVDGQTIEVDRSKLNNPNEWMMQCGNGTFAIILSFARILEHAKENGFSNVMICEDDVVFRESFLDRADKFLNDVPDDWDVLYFGGNHVDHYPHKITEHLSKCVSTRTTHSMVFRDTCYDKVINEILKFNDPLDEIFAKMQRDRVLNAYTTIPVLAWQFDSFSDIEECFASYEFLETFDENDYEKDRNAKGFRYRNYTDLE
jgi:GR25 family glycosyltransferase involved in LPS biosynthesis